MSFDVEEVALRSATTADWAGSEAPVLAAGELGLDTDTGELVVGDGTSAYSALRSLAPKHSSATLAAGAVVVADTRVKATTLVVPIVRTLGTVTAAQAIRVAKSNGVSFTLTSAAANDTSVVDLLIFY